MSRSRAQVRFQKQFLPSLFRPSLWRSCANRLEQEVERTLKASNQFAKQREILLASLFNQIMQCFSSITHIKPVSVGTRDVNILDRFCVVGLARSPLTLTRI